jgi:hypothetical protein
MGTSIAAPGIEGRDAAVEHRELRVADGAHVAHEAVGHRAERAAHTRRRRQKLAPGGDPLGTAAAEHHDLARLEIIDDCDLELIGVFAPGDVEHLAEQPGPRKTREHKAVVERSDAWRHRLIAEPRLVEDIREHGRIEMLAYALEKSLIVSHRHGSPHRSICCACVL